MTDAPVFTWQIRGPDPIPEKRKGMTDNTGSPVPISDFMTEIEKLIAAAESMKGHLPVLTNAPDALKNLGPALPKIQRAVIVLEDFNRAVAPLIQILLPLIGPIPPA